jgi:hypothetical protein
MFCGNVNETILRFTAWYLGTLLLIITNFDKVDLITLGGEGSNSRPPEGGYSGLRRPYMSPVDFSLFHRSWQKCFSRVTATTKKT